MRAANLRGADLSGADLSGANLKGANVYSAELPDADLMSAKGLTQVQLGYACGNEATKLPKGLKITVCPFLEK